VNDNHCQYIIQKIHKIFGLFIQMFRCYWKKCLL